MSEIVRFMPASSTLATSDSVALAHRPAPALLWSQPEPSLDATLAFVERAAETLRSLQKDNEAASRQLMALRDQLQRERKGRESDAERFDQFVSETHRKVAASEAEIREAKALAITAIRRCEEMMASEAKALQRAKLAEARAAELEQGLQGLHKAIAFEFSSVLS